MSQYADRRRMGKAQRTLVFVSLLLLAWLLHVLLCDWGYRVHKPSQDYARIVAYQHGTTTDTYGRTQYICTGLFTGAKVEPGTAIIWGVVIPLGLLCADAYLLLGWRQQSRLARGRCPNCGYNLRGKLDAGCPECGWGR